MSTDDNHAALQEFKKSVNMSSKVLSKWLDTKESKAVGFKTTEGGGSVGHLSGQKIIGLLGKSPSEFTSDDTVHARKVVGYIHRYLAQRPAGDISKTHWRY